MIMDLLLLKSLADRQKTGLNVKHNLPSKSLSEVGKIDTIEDVELTTAVDLLQKFGYTEKCLRICRTRC